MLFRRRLLHIRRPLQAFRASGILRSDQVRHASGILQLQFGAGLVKFQLLSRSLELQRFRRIEFHADSTILIRTGPAAPV